MQFEIKAYHEPDGVTLLNLRAASLQEARQSVESQGYRVITVRIRRTVPALGRLRFGERFSVALFSQELLALLDSGLSLTEAIDTLSGKSQRAESKRVLSGLNAALREGKSFSRALESVPGTFPALYIATVRSSERTGDLPQALRRYLEYQQQINLVRDKVVSASVYPALLMIVGLMVVLFLLGYVVPRFSAVYEDLGNSLPLVSRLLMRWGQFVSGHAWSIAGTFLVGAMALTTVVTRPATGARIERWLWSFPVLGAKLHLYQLSRFTRTLAMLLKGGIPFVASLEMVGGLLRQPVLQAGLQRAVREIREGRAVSGAFERNGLATEVGVRMIAVGERSGEMGQMMERVAQLYDDEIARWLDWFMRLFEPLLMIFIGLAIGVIVLLMYLPIFELASSIQ